MLEKARVTGFDGGATQIIKTEEVTLILNTNEHNIKHKVGLLNLAEELGNVARACQLMVVPRDTFYCYKGAVEEDAVDALLNANRKKPNVKNRVDPQTESAVLKYTIVFPVYGQVRVNNELHKIRVFVSPIGVRSIWLRNYLANFKDRLNALEAKVAKEAIILTEPQVEALE